MEETKNYSAYRYGDGLSPGYNLKIEHSISVEHLDIASVVAQGTEAIQTMRQKSIEDENKAFEIVVAAATQWEKQAAMTQTYDRALAYLNTPEVKHTDNQWHKENGYRDREEISNRVYKMSCSVWEDTKYNHETKQQVPVAWYVTWDVYINSPKQGYDGQIAGQQNKRYTDKAAAIKYLEGRKKAYSHLFTELSPPIPKQYENRFTVNDLLLPGYTIEGQEPKRSEHTAAEGIESSDGGISISGEKKASVLGKLSTVKLQEKAVTVNPAAIKRKEDMGR